MEKCSRCGAETRERLAGVYDASKLLGISGITVRDAVREEVCPRCGQVEGALIPDLQGLTAAVGLWRVMDSHKLRGEEINFLRKALEYTGKEFASRMEVRPEAVSRWQGGTDIMGPRTEKLLRIAAGCELWPFAHRMPFNPSVIWKMKITPWKRTPDEVLAMEFVFIGDQPDREKWNTAA